MGSLLSALLRAAWSIARMRLAIALALLLLGSSVATARENYPGQFDEVSPALKNWVGGQKTKAGASCCNNSDGHKCDGVELNGDLSPCYDWDQEAVGEASKVHRVRLKVLDKWFEVPDAFINEDPNPTGAGFAWFFVYLDDGPPIKIWSGNGAYYSIDAVPVDEHLLFATDGSKNVQLRLYCFSLGPQG